MADKFAPSVVNHRIYEFYYVCYIPVTKLCIILVQYSTFIMVAVRLLASYIVCCVYSTLLIFCSKMKLFKVFWKVFGISAENYIIACA